MRRLAVICVILGLGLVAFLALSNGSRPIGAQTAPTVQGATSTSRLCNDGSTSTATAQGACSDHGGLATGTPAASPAAAAPAAAQGIQLPGLSPIGPTLCNDGTLTNSSDPAACLQHGGVAVGPGSAFGAPPQDAAVADHVQATVAINGQAAPTGTLVAAYNGLAFCGGGYTTNNAITFDLVGQFNPCETPHNSIGFKVNGFAADQSVFAPASGGSTIVVNLTAPGPVRPTPAPRVVTPGVSYVFHYTFPSDWKQISLPLTNGFPSYSLDSGDGRQHLIITAIRSMGFDNDPIAFLTAYLNDRARSDSTFAIGQMPQPTDVQGADAAATATSSYTDDQFNTRFETYTVTYRDRTFALFRLSITFDYTGGVPSNLYLTSSVATPGSGTSTAPAPGAAATGPGPITVPNPFGQ